MPGARPGPYGLHMDSTQTLHDFVLNLLTDPEARSAFQLDPEATLHQAGLGDITAADVQDVVPLVVDYASVQGGAGLAASADLGAAAESDPTNVIGQLQAVTEQLALGTPSPSGDGNLAAAGTIAVDSSGLAAIAGGGLGVGGYAGPDGVSADLSGSQDVAATLDSGVVEGVVDPVAADATGGVGSTASGNLEPVDGLLTGGSPVDGVLGPADSAVGSLLDDPTELVDALGVTESSPGAGAAGGSSVVDDPVGTVDGLVDGGGVGGVLEGSAGAGGSANGSLGASGQDSDGGLLDDPTDILF